MQTNKSIINFALFGSVIYVSFEYYRYRFIVKTKKQLQNIITPLSDNLDNEKWTIFFIKQIQLLEPEKLKLFIETIFWNVPLKYIEYFRILDAFMVTALGCEKINMPNKFSEEKIKKYHDQINEILLAFFQNNKNINNNDNQIVSIQNVLQKLNYPFVCINRSNVKKLEQTLIFYPFPLTFIMNAILRK